MDFGTQRWARFLHAPREVIWTAPGHWEMDGNPGVQWRGEVFETAGEADAGKAKPVKRKKRMRFSGPLSHAAFTEKYGDD